MISYASTKSQKVKRNLGEEELEKEEILPVNIVSVCVHVSMCVRACVSMCAYVCVCASMCEHVSMCVHVCEHVYICVHAHTCMHVCVSMCVGKSLLLQ